MSSYLIISALGDDRPGLISQLTEAIEQGGCNIEDSRMSILAGAFALIMQVSGSWNNLAKLESILETLGQRTDLTISTKRTEGRALSANEIPYLVEVITMDHPGIVHRVSEFFSSRGINIHDMQSTCHPAAHTGTPMFTLTLTIEVPGKTHITGLREQFMEFADSMNLDAIIEPLKL
jgi:glycine cleavage system transcriptional repressor